MTPAEDWLPPGFTELQTISWQSNNPSYGYRNRPLPLYPGLPGSRRTMRFGISCLLSCGANRLVPRFFPTGASICIAGRSVPLERLRTRRSLGLRVSLFAEHLAMRRTACPNGHPPHPPRLGRLQPLMHRGPASSIQLSRCREHDSGAVRYLQAHCARIAAKF